MALFGKSEAKAAKIAVAKDTVYRHLLNNGLVDAIVEDIKYISENNESSAWLTNATGYYDKHVRTVAIYEEGITIFNCSKYVLNAYEDAMKSAKRAVTLATITTKADNYAESRRTALIQAEQKLDGVDGMSFHFTQYRFTPLPEYADPANEIYLSKQDVIAVFASVLAGKMTTLLPGVNCFAATEYMNALDVTVCEYTVPKLTWNTWFGGAPVEH